MVPPGSQYSQPDLVVDERLMLRKGVEATASRGLVQLLEMSAALPLVELLSWQTCFVLFLQAPLSAAEAWHPQERHHNRDGDESCMSWIRRSPCRYFLSLLGGVADHSFEWSSSVSDWPSAPFVPSRGRKAISRYTELDPQYNTTCVVQT